MMGCALATYVLRPSKVVPVSSHLPRYGHGGVWRRRVTDTCFLDLGNSFTPRPFYLRKSPRYPLGGIQRKFLFLSVLELRPLCHPAGSQSLYRLRYRDSILAETFPSSPFPRKWLNASDKTTLEEWCLLGCYAVWLL
jgi:hypothetical protein